jgi:hypothetical protein
MHLFVLAPGCWLVVFACGVCLWCLLVLVVFACALSHECNVDDDTVL